MKYKLIIFKLVCLAVMAQAQNPLGPPGLHFADPSAKVFNGTLYLYGSLDESCDHWCSWRHHVLSTDDMVNWHVTEDVFSSKGPNDEVPYSDKLLFAPDVQQKADSFYLYFCMPDRNMAEGVAFGTSPTGPFKNGMPLDLNGISQIDPSVFVDDNGDVIYIWGQFSLKMAKLKYNMHEIDLSTLKDSVITEAEHFFHEGAYLTKHNGLYYLVYADISREEKPTCLGYATSTDPFGPYKYRGVIIDNDGCNPGNWNNHGSIAKFKDQWYVFYHRSTQGCQQMRQSCVEPIFFNDDGTIDEVNMTSQGAAEPLMATDKIEARRACVLVGDMFIDYDKYQGDILTNTHHGDKAYFKYIDFGEGVNKVVARVKFKKPEATLALFIGHTWNQVIGKVNADTSSLNEWQEISLDIDQVTGTHALGLWFLGGNDLCDVDWVVFE